MDDRAAYSTMNTVLPIPGIPAAPMELPIGSRGLLDTAAFPHLLDDIVSFAPHRTLLQLRLVSRAVRDRVDVVLFRHLVVLPARAADWPLYPWTPRDGPGPKPPHPPNVFLNYTLVRAGSALRPLLPPRDYLTWAKHRSDALATGAAYAADAGGFWHHGPGAGAAGMTMSESVLAAAAQMGLGTGGPRPPPSLFGGSVFPYAPVLEHRHTAVPRGPATPEQRAERAACARRVARVRVLDIVGPVGSEDLEWFVAACAGGAEGPGRDDARDAAGPPAEAPSRAATPQLLAVRLHPDKANAYCFHPPPFPARLVVVFPSIVPGLSVASPRQLAAFRGELRGAAAVVQHLALVLDSRATPLFAIAPDLSADAAAPRYPASVDLVFTHYEPSFPDRDWWLADSVRMGNGARRTTSLAEHIASVLRCGARVRIVDLDTIDPQWFLDTAETGAGHPGRAAGRAWQVAVAAPEPTALAAHVRAAVRTALECRDVGAPPAPDVALRRLEFLPRTDFDARLESWARDAVWNA